MAKECNSTSCTKEDCAGCSQAKKPQSFQVAANEFSQVKKVIGVISGKGGVGKSFVTGVSGEYDGCEGVSSGHYGCGHYRSFDSQNVWNQGHCEGE